MFLEKEEEEDKTWRHAAEEMRGNFSALNKDNPKEFRLWCLVSFVYS